MDEQEVEIVLTDDVVLVGKLIARDAKSVTVIGADREVKVVPKSKVAVLRVAEVSAPASAPPSPPPLPGSPPSAASPPPPVITAPASTAGSTCVGLDCVMGPPPADTVVREHKQIERAGVWTMVGGAAGVGLGVILVGAGIGAARAAARHGCDSYGCDETRKLIAAGRTVLAGYSFLATGALTTIVGGVIYGVAHARVKRARNSSVDRVAMSPMQRGIGLSLSGRF